MHKRVDRALDGTDYTGKAYVEIHSHSCHKPSCPVCYLSWASREAHKIECRLAEAQNRFGRAEHIVVSLRTSDYSLRYEDIRNNVVKILEGRGIIGGCVIFHGFRYKNTRLWYWSPHFHVLGVIKGDYRCRTCNHERDDCSSCEGFNGKEVRGFERDGYIVKVLDKRISVFWTAYYQLNHSTIRTNVKRPLACTWFGVCSYRKPKVKAEKKKYLYPICGEELIRLHHTGVRLIVREKGNKGFVFSFVDDLVDSDGSPNWVEAPSKGYRNCCSSGYE